MKKLSFYLVACVFFAGIFATSSLSGMEERVSRYELPTSGFYTEKTIEPTMSPQAKKILSICIVLLDKKSGPYIDAMTQSVLNMLSQKTAPIVTTYEVLRDAKRQYEKTLKPIIGVVDVKNLELKFNEFYAFLEKKPNAEDVIAKRNNLLTTLKIDPTSKILPFAIFHQINNKLSFFEQNWTILKTENSVFYLLLPKPYLLSHNIGPKEIHQNLEKIGFNKNKWMEATLEEIDTKITKGKDNTITYESLTALFSLQTNKCWNIYMKGHGSYEKNIAGLKRDDFLKFLHFLGTTLRTNLLFYSTCYGGGIVLKKIEETLDKIKLQELLKTTIKAAKEARAITKQLISWSPFTIISGATTDVFSLALYEKWNKETLQQILKLNTETQSPNLPWCVLPSEINYYNFFKQLEQKKVTSKEEKNYFKKLVLHIAPIGVILSSTDITDYLYNLFSIKLPGMPGFHLLEIDEKIQVLTIVETKKAEIEKNDIIVSNKVALAVYPSIINAPIKIEGPSLPILISMSPYQDTHYFSEIKIDSCDISSEEKKLVQIILKLTEIPTARKKSFYFEKVTTVNEENLKEIIGEHLLITAWIDRKDHINPSRRIATFFDRKGKLQKFDYSTNQILPSENPADFLNLFVTIINGETLGLKFNQESFESLTSLKRFDWPHYLANNYQTKFVPIALILLERHAKLFFIAPGEADEKIIKNAENWGIFLNQLSQDENITEGKRRTLLNKSYLIILRGLQATGQSIQDLKQLKTNIIKKLSTVPIQIWHTSKLLPLAFDILGISPKFDAIAKTRLDTLDSLNKQIAKETQQAKRPQKKVSLQLLKDKKFKDLRVLLEQLETKKEKVIDISEKKLLQNLMSFVYSYINRYKATLILQELKTNVNPNQE